MTHRINISIILTLLLFACNVKTGDKETEKNIERLHNPINEIKSGFSSDKDFGDSANLFVQEILKENIRVHAFDLKNPESPKFLRIFRTDGLENIRCYSNKNYPKKIEPNYYEHFILFVANYNSSENARKSFEQIKSDAKYKLENLGELKEDLAERVEIMTIGAKPGGMITQNGRQVFSLVETCRFTPIGGKWIDYENKFIEFITEDGQEIEVLNADCGMFSYKTEIRKASR